MDPVKIHLPSGQTLVVRVLGPPLGEYAERIEYWWRGMRASLLAGELVETSLDRFIVGELDGEYVGSMTYATPRDTRDVAILGMVWTRPDQRQKGIATALLDHTLADFRAGGGMAVYLCTVNPHAFRLYHKAGFRSLVGDGMRYLAPGHKDFDRFYFAYAGPAAVRPGVWGDLARVSALYNQPHPDWLIKDYPRRVFGDMRYERHYIDIWKPANEGRGTVRVLENPSQRVVGVASLVEVDSYYEQHVQVLDFWACPAYVDQVPDLLEGIVATAAGGNAEILQAFVADVDREKQELLRAGGFCEGARLPQRLRVGDRRVDLLIYTRTFHRWLPPAHPVAAYYGARPSFQDLPLSSDRQ